MGAQARLLRKFVRMKREEGENMTDLIIRSNSMLKHKLRNTDIKHEWRTEDAYSFV